MSRKQIREPPFISICLVDGPNSAVESPANNPDSSVDTPVNIPQQGPSELQDGTLNQEPSAGGQNSDGSEVVGEGGGENEGENEELGGDDDYDGVISIGDNDNEGPITDIDIPGENGGQQEAITRPPPPEEQLKSNYTLDPDSFYPCVETGYFAEDSNCREFYMCREVLPG